VVDEFAQDRMNHGRKHHASHPCLLRSRNKLLADFSFVLKSSWGDVEDSFHAFQRFGYSYDVGEFTHDNVGDAKFPYDGLILLLVNKCPHADFPIEQLRYH
jgi:hypothetical protein